MNKKDLATQIFNDLIDEHLIDDTVALNNRENIIESIQRRLSTYLIIEGGNILRDDKGNIRIQTDENEDIKGEWVDAEIKPEPEGELSTGFIRKNKKHYDIIKSIDKETVKKHYDIIRVQRKGQ